MDPKEIEAASAVLYKAPRVSLSDIEANIFSVAYIGGDQLFDHAAHIDRATKGLPSGLEVMTICMLIMKNGWVVVGTSAPASPENFDAAHGRKLAYDRCIMQIWPLMGYALKEQLHNAK